MESLLEIKDILDRLNPRERKAAKNYFSIHYEKTKELQLLNLIENLNEGKRISIKNRIQKLGYESLQCKSFQKLRSRLKRRLFDYLSSGISVSEFRKIDDNSYLKHNLKKELFQTEILIEKGFYLQANDLLRSNLKIAQETEQFSEVVLILEKLRQLTEIDGNIQRTTGLSEKIYHFGKKSEWISNLEISFNDLISQIDIHGMDFVSNKIMDLSKKIKEDQNSYVCDRIKLISNYLDVLRFQSERNFSDALSVAIKQLKIFRAESVKFNIRHKMLFYESFVELLFILGHKKMAMAFLQHTDMETKPLHLKHRLMFLANHEQLIEAQNQKTNALINFVSGKGKDELILIYQLIFQTYLTGNFRKTIDLVNQNIRKYNISSIQQLDLMLLELICYYELQHFDLLDYKISSYLKNLSYRTKYDIPVHFHLMGKIFKKILRSKNRSDNSELNNMIRELTEMEVNGLWLYRSFFPVFFIRWIKTQFSNQLMATEPALNKVA